MDCGPAALHAIFDSVGLSVPYARIRDLCNTEVDGTSIDGLISVATGLGFKSEELLVPADHLLLADIVPLPFIAVTRTTRDEAHYIVIWRCYGNWL